MVGNGGGYVGGGDESTQEQVEAAVADVRKDLGATAASVASGESWDKLYAKPDCDPHEAVCAASASESDEKRRFARDLILAALAGFRRELVEQPVSIQLVETLPELVDAFGHPRDARAATTAQPGAPILLSAPKYRAIRHMDLRATMVRDIAHEIMHHLTGQKDRAAYGAYSEADGTQACFTFIGEIFDALTYGGAKGSRAVGLGNGHSGSTMLPLAGIPGAAIRGSPTAVVSRGGIYVFVVGKSDSRVYVAFFNGTIMSEFSPVLALTSTTDVGAVAYASGTANGIVLATVSGAGYVSLHWFNGAGWRSLGTLAAANLHPGGAPAFTASAPKVFVFGGDLYVGILGINGVLYTTGPQQPLVALTSGYAAIDGTVTTQAPEFSVVWGKYLAYYTVSLDGHVLYNQLDTGWGPSVATSFITPVRPARVRLGGKDWFAFLDGATGKVQLQGYAGPGMADAQRQAFENEPTQSAFSLVVFNGRLVLFTAAGDCLYATVGP